MALVDGIESMSQEPRNDIWRASLPAEASLSAEMSEEEATKFDTPETLKALQELLSIEDEILKQITNGVNSLQMNKQN